MNVKVNFVNINDDELILVSEHPDFTKFKLVITTNPNKDGLPNTVFIDPDKDYLSAVLGEKLVSPINKVLDYVQAKLPDTEIEFSNVQRAESAIMFVLAHYPAIRDYEPQEQVWINEHVTGYYSYAKDAYQLHCTKSFTLNCGTGERRNVKAGEIGGYIKDAHSLRNDSWIDPRIILEAGCLLDNSYITTPSASGPALRVSNLVAVDSVISSNSVSNSIVVASDVLCQQLSNSFVNRRKLGGTNGIIDNAIILLGDEPDYPIGDILRNLPSEGGILISKNHPFVYHVNTKKRVLYYYDLASTKCISGGKDMVVTHFDELWDTVVDKPVVDKGVEEILLTVKDMLSDVIGNTDLSCNMNNLMAKPKGSSTITGWAKTLACYQLSKLAEKGNVLTSRYSVMVSKLRQLVKEGKL